MVQKLFRYILLALLYICPTLLFANTGRANILQQQQQQQPKGKIYPCIIENGDTLPLIYLREVTIYPPMRFKSEKETRNYWRTVRDVKKTLPYAKEIAGIIIETYEYMETLPSDKLRQQHLEKMEDYLKKEYTPKMKKLTASQGQLLMKLVDRESKSSSYEIVQAFMGNFKAWTYNVFASLFGNSLKKRYDPEGTDRLVEQIAVMVEQGAL